MDAYEQMSKSLEPIRRVVGAVLAVAFLGAGVGVLVWFVETKPEAPRHNVSKRPLEVLTETVKPHEASWPVVGYGTVRPKHQVSIIPQVSGKLVRVHEDLAEGKIIPKGELLFEIDPTVYDARAAQARAEVRQLRGVIARHEEDGKSLQERLSVAERMLAIEQDNYQATKALYENEDVGTPQQVAADEERYLRQKDVAIQLKSRLAMVPHLLLEAQAQLDAAEARLKQADHELENTKILCPFEARVESVGAYTSQVVTAHFSIATLTDMEAFEILVGINPRDLLWLEESAKPEFLEREKEATAQVVVRSSLRGREYTWRGLVTRFERVDEATRTAKMVIEVCKVDMVSRPGVAGEQGLSLSLGMYCKAELPGRQLVDAMLVPRHAIHDNKWVYVFEPDELSTDPRAGHLGRRQVPVLRSVRDGVLVDYRGRLGGDDCELKANERVVVSPLKKPVVGMKVLLRDERFTSGPAVIIPESSPIVPLRGLAGSPSFLLGHTCLAPGVR